jgi:hypothetical protein
MNILYQITSYLLDNPILMVIEAILAVAGFIQLVISPIRKIWARDNWIAEFRHDSVILKTQELQNTLSKDTRKLWISPDVQTKGDFYRVDFGKYIVIDGVEFYEKVPTNEFPHKWTLLLQNEWRSLVTRPVNGEGRIIKEFPPIKVYAIEIVINEPMFKDDGTPYHWMINNVYFREVKLFRRWIRIRV